MIHERDINLNQSRIFYLPKEQKNLSNLHTLEEKVFWNLIERLMTKGHFYSAAINFVYSVHDHRPVAYIRAEAKRHEAFERKH